MSDAGSDSSSTGGGPARPSDFVADPDLKRLFEYWRGKRGGRPMPSKEDIDPVEIGWALSRLFLTDYRPGEGFTYRLSGTEIASVRGRSNLKGCNLRDVVSPERLELVERAWMQVVESRAVVRMAGTIYYAIDRTPIGERLLLPLTDRPEGPVTGLLGMTVWNWVSGEVPKELTMPRVETLPVSEIP